MDSNPTQHYDVAIAGAGLAGSALAVHLARAGANVVVLDTSGFPRDKLCGEYLSPEGWGALVRLGLEEALTESGFQPIRVARLSTPRGRVVEAEVVGPDGLPGVGISRFRMDAALVHAARVAGAEVVEQARVSGPVIEQDQVVGLSARHLAEGSFSVNASVVIAANGRHSTLVRQTGTTKIRSLLRPRYFGLKRHMMLGEDHPAADPPGTVSLHMIPGGYVGSCRVEGGLTNLCGLLPEAFSRAARGDLDALADDHFQHNRHLRSLWKAGSREGAWKTVAGVRVEYSAPRMPGIFYAGDCQGTVDPLGGQGMTMALLGAELLAPFILKALGAGHERADISIARAYGRAWHRRFDHRIRLCRLFHHALLNPRLIDGMSWLGRPGAQLLATAYGWTRDPDHSASSSA